MGYRANLAHRRELLVAVALVAIVPWPFHTLQEQKYMQHHLNNFVGLVLQAVFHPQV
jgi:hypothetical protein